MRDYRVRLDAELSEPRLSQAKLSQGRTLDEARLIALAEPQRPTAGEVPVADRQERMRRARRYPQPRMPQLGLRQDVCRQCDGRPRASVVKRVDAELTAIRAACGPERHRAGHVSSLPSSHGNERLMSASFRRLRGCHKVSAREYFSVHKFLSAHFFRTRNF